MMDVPKKQANGHRMHTLLRVLSLVCAAAAFTTSLTGCATTGVPLDQARHTLAEREVLPLGERLSITYEGALDSRCPVNARCVWPGLLAYRFTMRIGNVAQGFYLVPGGPGYMSPALRGARVALDHMTPLPPPPLAAAAGAGLAPVPYPVTFNIYAQ